MKTLIIVILLLASIPWIAEASPKIGKCYPGFPFGHYVVAAHPGGFIEMVSAIEGRGLLKTSVKSFKSGPVAMPMKLIGEKEMELKNGFTAKVKLWAECQMPTAAKAEMPSSIPNYLGSAGWIKR